ncbi:MAG: branched-chain amino acid ABC transporter permease, partial [Aquihabitans sp.]
MKLGSESHSPTRAAARALFAALVCVIGICSAWASPVSAQAGPAQTAATDGCGFTKADAVAANGGPLGESIWGQLCQRIDGKATYPAGVTITVKQDGKLVASETTGANGVFVVKIPGNGTYQVSLDKASLPKTMTLTDSGRTSLDKVAVQFGDQQVIFPLGVASSAGRSFSDYATTFAKGLRFGLILAVASVGLSLVYGVTGLVNFAHAELVTFGAIGAYTVSEAGVPFWLALPIAVGFGAALGLGNERLLWRPLRRRRMSLLSMMVVSIGLSIALRNIFQIQFGPDGRRYEAAAGQREHRYGPFRLTDNDLLIMVVCVVVLLAMTWLLRRTRTGTAIRAVADNHDLAES